MFSKIVSELAKFTGLKNWMVIAGLVVLVVLALGTSKCVYDAHVVNNAVTKANNKTLKQQQKANEQASEERMNDASAAASLRQEYEHAISHKGECDPPSARQRFACQQLRADGTREADLPASCRCSGSGEGKAESGSVDRR